MEDISAQEFNSRLILRSQDAQIPVRSSFELTYGCNLNCVHCYNPTHRRLPHEISTEKIYKTLEEISGMGCFLVGFTGGEPFVHPQALDIFRKARSLGLEISILTNATLLDEKKVRALEEISPTLVSVSVYGLTEKTYESVTRVPGSFNLFQKGRDLLISSRLSLAFKMPVMTLNRHEFESAKHWYESRGLQWNHSVEIHPRTNGDLEPLQFRLDPEEAVQFRFHHEDEWGCVVRDRLQENPRQSKKEVIPCSCGKSSFAVTPYGEMNLCTTMPVPMFNLQTGTIREGWSHLSQLVQSVQASEQFKCPTCPVARSCSQGSMDSYLENREWDSCLPYFKEVASRLLKRSEEVHK